jgi:hypothetical protein
MNANELADFVEISKPDDKTHQTIATMLRQQQEQINNLKQWEKRQLDVIEALKQSKSEGNNKVKTVAEVMSENCTCYKLGYSPLNDYASVKQK